MSPTSAAFLTRRRCVHLHHYFDPLRSFSTQTQTQTRDSSSINKEGARRRVPWILAASQRSPETCKLFSLGKLTEHGRDENFLYLQRQVPLPGTAPSVKTLFTGSSPNGFVFFTTRTNQADIFAVNPINGLHLPLPSASSLRRLPFFLNDYKTLVSPSHDIVILNRIHFADFARVGDERWTPLPDGFAYMQDFIFHKGFLYAVDHGRNIAVFDFNNPSSPAVVSGGAAPHMRRHADHIWWCSWLVESPDGKDLFLVCRHKQFGLSRHGFKVFKLNGNGKWKRVKSIGDMAIFVGINQAVSLSASDFPDALKPNSIYFADIPKKTRSRIDMSPKVGVFTLDDERRIHTFVESERGDMHLPHIWRQRVWFMPITAPPSLSDCSVQSSRF